MNFAGEGGGDLRDVKDDPPLGDSGGGMCLGLADKPMDKRFSRLRLAPARLDDDGVEGIGMGVPLEEE